MFSVRNKKNLVKSLCYFYFQYRSLSLSLSFCLPLALFFLCCVLLHFNLLAVTDFFLCRFSPLVSSSNHLYIFILFICLLFRDILLIQTNVFSSFLSAHIYLIQNSSAKEFLPVEGRQHYLNCCKM